MSYLFCDVDGVIRDLLSGIAVMAGKEMTPEIYNNVSSWDCEIFGKRIKDWIRVPSVFLIAPPYSGSLDFIEKVSEKYKVIFFTCQNRIPDFTIASVEWLHEWRFDEYSHGLFFVHSYEDKMKFIDSFIEEPECYFLDDHPDLCEKFILFDNFLSFVRPWNPCGDVKSYDDVIHILGG